MLRAAEARKLIGKKVEWLDTYCQKRGYIKREGLLLDVQGKNVLIDQYGTNDWKWLPDMRCLKEAPNKN